MAAASAQSTPAIDYTETLVSHYTYTPRGSQEQMYISLIKTWSQEQFWNMS